MATVCKRVYYSGHVQGVGFRYTAQALADPFRVAGYVRNLPNGDVVLVAEGEPDQVNGFLAALAQRMAGHVTHTVVEDEAPSGLNGFRIRY
jgi:acylphosphatase